MAIIKKLNNYSLKKVPTSLDVTGVNMVSLQQDMTQKDLDVLAQVRILISAAISAHVAAYHP
jgi:hypothetical protein